MIFGLHTGFDSEPVANILEQFADRKEEDPGNAADVDAPRQIHLVLDKVNIPVSVKAEARAFNLEVLRVHSSPANGEIRCCQAGGMKTRSWNDAIDDLGDRTQDGDGENVSVPHPETSIATQLLFLRMRAVNLKFPLLTPEDRS